MAEQRRSKTSTEPAPEPGIAGYAPTAPQWLRDLGVNSWLIVGIGVVVVGAVWLLELTQVIVTPVIVAAVIAAVATPVVSWLAGHHVPRYVGAALMLMTIALLAGFVIFIVIHGITSEADSLGSHLADAKQTIEGWLKDLGISAPSANQAVSDASSGSSKSVSTLIHGLSDGVKQLSSLVFFLALTALSLLFLMADGPSIRSWGERNMGLPLPVARNITSRSIGALRGYFLGVTLVAAFNAIVVTAGALIIGVPMAGTIGVVTFVAAYVPYLGAWTAGAFSVLIALGGSGTEAAVAMIVVQLLANGVLQQLVQPFAMGTALGIHPLAVLIVTIAGGALFGTVGLILAAPVTAAVTRISADLKAARVGDAPPPAQREIT
jgi:predicted PurR-regulated permease PerM